ncbi:hypothetical protein Peur_015649 [Populus x canadensis]
MQSLYAHTIGELKKLKTLVINAKEHGIKVVPALVKRMLEKNMFLFGFVDLHEGSVSEAGNQLTELQDARVQVAYKKLFDDIRIEQFLHMDMVNWNVQRQVFYQQTGLNQRHALKDEQQHQPQHKKNEQHDDDFGDEFSHQLELQLIEEEQLQQKQEDDECNHELEL